VHVHDVDEITRFIAPRQRKNLVDGEVHRVEQEAAQRVTSQRHEPPRRVVRPVHPRRVASATHQRLHETGTQIYLHCVAGPGQQRAVRAERRCDTRLRIVKKVEIIAVADRIGSEMQRSTAGQIAILRRRCRKLGQQSAAQLHTHLPRLPVAMLHQLFGNPRYVVRSDLQIRTVRPEAERPEPSERTPGFPHTHHPAGNVGLEPAPALATSVRPDPGQIASDLTHARIISGL